MVVRGFYGFPLLLIAAVVLVLQGFRMLRRSAREAPATRA